jgi:hypothetical protein
MTRLRDVSTEAEKDYKTKIAEMEREITANDDLISQSPDARPRPKKLI